MSVKNRLAGRFLPSRVYARWKWTVRFGLSALPLILFIAGSVVFYLTPTIYQSKAVFEYLGKRPTAEVVALLDSQQVISEASKALEAATLLGVDSYEAVEIISQSIQTKVDPGTGFIELTADHPQQQFSRDLAAELPKALDSYEKSTAVAELTARIEAEGRLAHDAGDIAAEKRAELLKWFIVHPGEAKDPSAQLAIDELRGNWQNAVGRAHESNNRLADSEIELSARKSLIQIRSQPEISSGPLSKETGDSLGAVILEALASGLAFALAAPYLLELAFPRRRRTPPTLEEIGFEKAENIGIMNSMEKLGAVCKS